MDLYLEHVYSDDFCLEAFLKNLSISTFSNENKIWILTLMYF